MSSPEPNIAVAEFLEQAKQLYERARTIYPRMPDREFDPRSFEHWLMLAILLNDGFPVKVSEPEMMLALQPVVDAMAAQTAALAALDQTVAGFGADIVQKLDQIKNQIDD